VVLTPTEVEAMWQQVLDFRVSPEAHFDVEIDRQNDGTDIGRRTA
jgi:cyanophycin synthetase